MTMVGEIPVNKHVEAWIESNAQLYEEWGDQARGFTSLLKSHVIPKGFGVCAYQNTRECESFARRVSQNIVALYAIEYADVTDYQDDAVAVTPAGCKHCLEEYTVANLCSYMIHRNHWSSHQYFPLDSFPIQDDSNLEHCSICEGYIADPTMRNELSGRNMPSLNLRGVPLISNGLPSRAHEGCVKYCESCQKYFDITTTEFTSFYRAAHCPACTIARRARAEEDGENLTDCESCYTFVDEDDLRRSHINDDYICEWCMEHEYRCDDCDTWYLEDEGHDCDGGYDDNGDDARRRNLIRNYSYKPAPQFHGAGLFHFGVELEVEATDSDKYWDTAELISNRLGTRAYLKHDGSLRNGFEIVTHPHSLQNFQAEFPWQILDDLKVNGFRSWKTKTCGLHVHVSRSAFNAPTYDQRDTHQIKFMKLIYDNKDQVQKLAGRKSSWAKFDDKGQIVRKVKMGYQSEGRYSAVNVENAATLEVRVFRGSLRKERVLSAIEFVHAAVEYTRDLKIVPKNNPFAWTSFIGYAAEHRDMYPNLLIIVDEMLAKAQSTISRQEEPV